MDADIGKNSNQAGDNFTAKIAKIAKRKAAKIYAFSALFAVKKRSSSASICG
jgi:hypothetical protein